jgi:hypothetical protein
VRRFNENATFDRLADRRALSPDMVKKLAFAILTSQARPLSGRRGGDRRPGNLSEVKMNKRSPSIPLCSMSNEPNDWRRTLVRAWRLCGIC